MVLPNLALDVLSDLVSNWNAMPGWAWILILFALAFLAGYFVERVVMATLRMWAKRTTMTFDDDLVDALHPSISIICFVAFVWVGLRYISLRLSPITVSILDNASAVIIVLAAALAGARIARVLLHLGMKREERWRPLAVTSSRVAALVIYVMAFLIIIHRFGIEITPILTTLGIAGLAVALALQDTLANVFSGIWIQTQRSMQPGHYVRFEDSKLEGFVEEVGWRTTRVRTLPGNIIVVPNQTVARSTIQDFWLPQPKMGTSITVTTGFEADPERIVPMMLEECMAAADEVSFVLKEPAPAARLNRAVENGWEYWMSIWVPYYYNQWNAQGYVLNKIRKRFLKEGIRMPYPIRETVAVAPERGDVASSIASMQPQPFPDAAADLRSAVAEGDRSAHGPGTVRPTK